MKMNGAVQPCLEIQKDVDKSYELTRPWNTLLAATNSTAVIHEEGEGLNPIKAEKVCLTDKKKGEGTLAEVIRAADVSIGVSVPGAAAYAIVGLSAEGDPAQRLRPPAESGGQGHRRSRHGKTRGRRPLRAAAPRCREGENTKIEDVKNYRTLPGR